MSIKYDSTELLGATYIPRYVQHETAPERIINSVKLARQDGDVIIDDTMSIKYIDIVGILVGSSRSDLDTKIDAFKELISRRDKNLDITWGAGTRRYVCRSINHEFKRDYYNTNYVSYSIRFFVPTGYGTDTTADATVFSKDEITATTDSESVVFEGSYPPRATHYIGTDLVTGSRGNADIVRLENVTTGDYIDIDLGPNDATGFRDGDYIVVNEENQTVLQNGDSSKPMTYRGRFPFCAVGTNSLKLTFYGSGSYALDQEQENINPDGKGSLVYNGTANRPWGCQSFIPSNSGRLKKISLPIHKQGSPTGYAYFNIFDDNNGKPGQMLNSNSYYRIAMASIPAIGAISWSDFIFGSAGSEPYLTKGKRYWIVNFGNRVSGSDVSNYLYWPYSYSATDYLYGKAIAAQDEAGFIARTFLDGIADASEADGVDAGQFDNMFRTYLNNNSAANHNFNWIITYTKKYL